MALVGLVTDPSHVAHERPGHPERPERAEAITRHLAERGLARRMVGISPREATDDELLAVHDRSLLVAVDAAAMRPGAWLDPDTYVNAGSPALARRAAGGTVQAVEAVLSGGLDSAFVAMRPCGHHATRDRAMGFCLFNQVAVAAAGALRSGLDRVAIVDWDVHHGNGTQDIFDADPRVLYLSTHASPFYPGTGAPDERGSGEAAGTKVNVPLPHGTGDRGFIAAYEQVLLPALDRFAPDLVLVSCGWDSHARDPLGTLAVSTEGYTRVARLVLEAAQRHARGRLVAVLEGGYDPHALAWCASALCEVLLGDEPTPDPEPGAGKPAQEMDLSTVFAQARKAAGLE